MKRLVARGILVCVGLGYVVIVGAMVWEEPATLIGVGAIALVVWAVINADLP